jgi:hypothetical protein
MLSLLSALPQVYAIEIISMVRSKDSKPSINSNFCCKAQAQVEPDIALLLGNCQGFEDPDSRAVGNDLQSRGFS